MNNSIPTVDEIKNILLAEAKKAQKKAGFVVVNREYKEDGSGVYSTSAAYSSIKLGGGYLAIINNGDILYNDSVLSRHDWWWGDECYININNFCEMIRETWEEETPTFSNKFYDYVLNFYNGSAIKMIENNLSDSEKINDIKLVLSNIKNREDFGKYSRFVSELEEIILQSDIKA